MTAITSTTASAASTILLLARAFRSDPARA
jgi:hypothetical protein